MQLVGHPFSEAICRFDGGVVVGIMRPPAAAAAVAASEPTIMMNPPDEMLIEVGRGEGEERVRGERERRG
jgi:hypothetical protein